MCASVISETDARRGLLEMDTRNKMGNFDGCARRSFEQRMHARYGANSGCAQPTPASNPSNQRKKHVKRKQKGS